MRSTSEILSKIRHLELKTKQLVDSAFAGHYHSVFKGRGMNFDEVREYQPGDEIRSIDWNVTARTGQPYIKKYTEERELTVIVMVDVSASGNYGSDHLSKRELAAEVACILAFSAVRNQDKVGLVLFSDDVELYIPPKKGRQHVLRLIREIVYFEPQGSGTDPKAAFTYINRVLSRRAVVFCLSDFVCGDIQRPLAITSRRHDLVAIPIIDPCEQELPDIGIVNLEDAETGEQIEVNTSNRTVRERFRAAAIARHEALLSQFGKLAIDTISLRCGKDDDYLPALRNFFATRERRLTLS